MPSHGVFEGRSTIKLSSDAPVLSIGLPARKRSPLEFWMHMFQALHPLNVRTGYIFQKAAEEHVADGKLPAAARNAIIETALRRGSQYLLFLDDDILFPDITVYRLWNVISRRPEIGAVTGVYGTKLSPTEPLLYRDTGDGAFWDWPLGALVPIESAGAGCQIINLAYVRNMPEPWFDDVVQDVDSTAKEHIRRNVWGHDRHFHLKLAAAGGPVYADTGLLLGHFDADLQKTYILPSDAPCFQRPLVGEAFVPFFAEDGFLAWRRLYTTDDDAAFVGYLDWLSGHNTSNAKTISLVQGEHDAPTVTAEVSARPVDGPQAAMGWLRRVQGPASRRGDQPHLGGDQSRPAPEPGHGPYVQREGYTVADRRRCV